MTVQTASAGIRVRSLDAAREKMARALSSRIPSLTAISANARSSTTRIRTMRRERVSRCWTRSRSLRLSSLSDASLEGLIFEGALISGSAETMRYCSLRPNSVARVRMALRSQARRPEPSDADSLRCRARISTSCTRSSGECCVRTFGPINRRAWRSSQD